MGAEASFESQVVGTTLVIRISGYLNSRIGNELGQAVDAVLEKGGRRVLINFSSTKMMNSVGISSVAAIVRRMAELEGCAAFCSLAGMNREIFATMGVTGGVELFETEFEALAWFESKE
jgi:anti-anti-sigma regulatory factor